MSRTSAESTHPGVRAAPDSKAWLRAPQFRVLLFLFLWTLFASFALWWLFKTGDDKANPASWVLHRGDSPQQSFIERARDWFRLVHLNFQRIYPWVLLGPYVAWLAFRFSLERGRLKWSLPIHIAACWLFLFAAHTINEHTSMQVARIVVITTHHNVDQRLGLGTNILGFNVPKNSAPVYHEERITSVAGESFDHAGPPDFLALTNEEFSRAVGTNEGPNLFTANAPFPPPEMPTLRPLATLLDLLAYGAIAGLGHAIHFYRRFRERERRALFLESNLAKARLGALQAQLQPHFLFNSLNAIAALLRRDPRLAESTLTSLSELLRLALSQSEKQEVPLREELEFVDRYLEIQQTRFGERLRFEKKVDPDTLDCLVPTLLLQPIVENAIRHGIEPSENGSLVRVIAQKQNDRLVLTVEDDGIGVNTVASLRETGSGIGLPNLRARLEALYGANHKLLLSPAESRGTVVTIEVPCRLPHSIQPDAAIPVLSTAPNLSSAPKATPLYGTISH